MKYSDIGKIEKGIANITMLILLELAKGLEIHPKKLLDFDFEERKNSVRPNDPKLKKN
jgi:transcriptional regulator with XRE-family HTH domain